MSSEGVYPNKSRKELKLIARHIEKESKEYSSNFVPIGMARHIPGSSSKLLKVFRNRYYLVQVHLQGEWTRISISKTILNPDTNRWSDGISWDALMDIKSAIGYGDRDAVEIYPMDKKVVNVANIRHLFLLPEDHDLSCIWEGSGV